MQKKWCKLVEHIAKEPLDPRAMPRRLTVFLEAPPTDGLRIAQDHFKEYVKPILVASGLDWEFVQGRKEGDVRAELAARIRRERTPVEERTDVDEIEDVRRQSGVIEYDGPRGDIILGRHTWKEYVRGLHEGWLGPLTEPPKPVVEEAAKPEDATPEPEPTPIETLPGITIHSTTSEEPLPPASETPKAEDKPKNAPKPAPFIPTSAYTSATLPLELPAQFSPSTPITFPHILGFLNTPKRMYRFLNRRAMADSIGRETAAIILGGSRPYHSNLIPSELAAETDFSSPSDETSTTTSTTPTSEQALALQEEEKEWHKTVRKRVEGEPERTWLEPMVLDERIASRMRRFEIGAEDEEKSRSIVVPEVEVEGWIKGGIRSLGRSTRDLVGLSGKVKPKSGSEMGLEGSEDE